MSESEFEIFNIETLLIENNEMESLQTSLDELIEVFPMPEEIIELIRVMMYKQYYSGRISSNKMFIEGLKKYVESLDNITDSDARIIQHIISISNNQLG